MKKFLLGFGGFGLRAFFLGAILIAGLQPSVMAHEVTPTIANFQVQENRLEVRLRINAEAFVAGIDLDDLTNTDETVLSTDYDMLRSIPPDEFEPMLRLALEDILSVFFKTHDASLPLAIKSVDVPNVGDKTLPRDSVVILSAPLDAKVYAVKVAWPKGAGALVLRQNGVDAPYTGYLAGGESSPSIPLKGGATQSSWEVFQTYVPVGFEHILPLGLDHILFVLGLFFLSSRLRVLLWQISAFTLAHTFTLALGATQSVAINPSIVEPLIAASIIFVAVENIFVRQLHSWRTLLVFGFGLLHGLGFATVLGEFGLPETGFLSALVGFNVGVELGQLAVIAIAYATVGFWFGKHPKYRGRVAIPASVTIAGIGCYWFVERVSAIV